MPHRQLEGEPLCKLNRERSPADTRRDGRVHGGQKDEAARSLFGELHGTAGVEHRLDAARQKDRPVRVVAHVGDVDEAAAARVDEPVLFGGEEALAETMLRGDEPAVVRVATECSGIDDVAHLNRRDRERGHAYDEIVAERAARAQVIGYREIRLEQDIESTRGIRALERGETVQRSDEEILVRRSGDARREDDPDKNDSNASHSPLRVRSPGGPRPRPGPLLHGDAFWGKAGRHAPPSRVRARGGHAGLDRADADSPSPRGVRVRVRSMLGITGRSASRIGPGR